MLPLPEGPEETRKEMGTEIPEHLLCPHSGPSEDMPLPLTLCG